MKRAVFLHGTGGSPNDHWWPWLGNQFERAGYEVWAPELPGSTQPSAERYWKLLGSAGWDFKDNVLVGHSSGATSVLNLLARAGFPRAKAAVLVGVFLNERLTRGSADFADNDQFIDLFPAKGFDLQALKERAERFYFVHGDDDPYCAYEDTKGAVAEVDGELITVASGGHLSGDSVAELPGLVSKLKGDGIL